MKIAKYLLTNILLSTVILLLLGSCDKKSETPSPSSVDSEAQAVELSFESIIGDNPKGLTFAQNNPSKPVVPENGVNVLCIIRSSGDDAPVYRVIKWERDPVVSNRIHLKKHKFFFPKGTTTAVGKKWYIMGIIGGTWDEKNKKVRVSTENIKTLDKDTPITLNVPAVSKWVEIPTDEKGRFVKPSSTATTTYIQIPFHAQGALMQHKFGCNKSKYNMSFTSFTVVSTAFSFKGHYDLSAGSLPNVNNSTAGHKNGSMLKWIPCGENVTKEYAATNAGVAEYEHKFVLPQPVTIRCKKKGDPKHVMTFWAMPTGQTIGKAKTNVFLEATASSSANTPKVCHLPSYGKKHTTVLKSGDFAEFTSVLYRPKLALEYMAEYNVRRNDEVQKWEKPGDRRVDGSSGKFATDHGPDAHSELRWDEALDHKISGYHLPTLEEFDGIIPSRYLKTQGAPSINMKNSTEVTYQKRVQVKDQFANVEVKCIGKGDGTTAYAIHFIESDQGNTRRVAYRYKLIPYNLFEPYLNKTIRRVDVLLDGRLEHVEEIQDGIPTSAQINTTNYLQIEMIYLGPYFLGNLQDIASDSWWEHAQRRKDKVVRYLSASGKRFYSYERESVLNPQDGSTQRRFFGIIPTSIAYWLNTDGVDDDRKPNTAPVQQYPIKKIFILTPFNGNDAYHQGMGSKVGASVRLFSNE